RFSRSRTGRWKFCFRTGRNAKSPEKSNSKISRLFLAICSKAYFLSLAPTAISNPFPKPKNVTWEEKNKKDVMDGRPAKNGARAGSWECAGDPVAQSNTSERRIVMSRQVGIALLGVRVLLPSAPSGEPAKPEVRKEIAVPSGHKLV